MLFEWRTYHFAPGRAAAYLTDFQAEGLPLVTRHLPLLGYWLTEAGRLNVLHHLWVYADLEDRAACRAGLAADRTWTEGFGPRAFPMIEAQENLMLALCAGSPGLDAAVTAARSPRQAATGPLLGPGWALLDIAETPPPLQDAVARWRVIAGDRPGTHVSLARSDTAGSIVPLNTPALRRDLMRPTGFSPLQ